MSEELKDDSPMPGKGKHAGEPMVKVPADYLIACYDKNLLSASVRKYVEQNMDVLKMELKKIKVLKNES